MTTASTPRRVRRPARALVCALMLGLPLSLTGAGCSSPGSGSAGGGEGVAAEQEQGPALRVTYRDLRSGVPMDFASNTHPVAEGAGTSSVKVLDVESMSGFIGALEGGGFDDVAQDGRAPRSNRFTRTLEIERDGRVAHYAVGESSPIQDLQRMNTLFDAVLATFNSVNGWRAVDNPSGSGFFYEQNSHLYERRR